MNPGRWIAWGVLAAAVVAPTGWAASPPATGPSTFAADAPEAALAALRQSFGPRYLYEIDEAHKFIFATNTDARTLAGLKKSLLAQAASQWQQLFTHKPEAFIIIIAPTPEDFRKIVPQRGVDGIYNRQLRTLIVRGLGFVTTHEFTHALHAADIEPLGQEHPPWVTEGLAVMFEHSEYVGDVLTPLDSFRLPYLQNRARANRLIPFRRLVAMSEAQFMSRPEVLLAYAESGSLMHYLYEGKLLRPFYDQFKAGYAKDPTGRAALEQATGMGLDDLEREWRKWMMQRTPPATYLGRGGPFLGATFREVTDGLAVEVLIPGAPAIRAGLKEGDVLVALGSIEVRDMPTFIAVMAAHKGGDSLVFHVRRGEDYLDMTVILGQRGD